MGSLYPLLLYAGFGGGLLLLGGELLPRFHSFRKPIVAAWLTLITLLWVTLPTTGRTLLSVWSPGTVLGGQVLISMTPAVWWGGLALGLIFSGATWVEVLERRPPLPLSGVLVFVALMVLWLSLTGGSLLTTLAAWAIFDLVWCVAALMSGADGERVTFGLALHGISSLILWVVSLLLQRSGVSSLWWLMWPTSPAVVLLVVAALIRVGFYPFQIVFPRGISVTHSLGLVYLMGPIPGIAMLYRLLLLPGVERFPAWVGSWGVLALVWSGLMAWEAQERQSLLWAGHGVLIAVVTGAGLIGSAPLLMLGSVVWMAAGALFVFMRGTAFRAAFWSWPLWLGLFFLLGVPPSPLNQLYSGLFAATPWLGRLPLFAGLTLIGAALVDGARRPVRGDLTPPWWWQRVALAGGMGAFLVPLIGVSVHAGWGSLSWLGLGLWLLSVLAALALVRWGAESRLWIRHGEPLLDLLDLRWFYRAVWQGAENLLGLLRVAAEVVEGSGAMLWSLLIILLILLVVANR